MIKFGAFGLGRVGVVAHIRMTKFGAFLSDAGNHL